MVHSGWWVRMEMECPAPARPSGGGRDGKTGGTKGKRRGMLEDVCGVGDFYCVCSWYLLRYNVLGGCLKRDRPSLVTIVVRALYFVVFRSRRTRTVHKGDYMST